MFIIMEIQRWIYTRERGPCPDLVGTFSSQGQKKAKSPLKQRYCEFRIVKQNMISKFWQLCFFIWIKLKAGILLHSGNFSCCAES